MNISSISNVNYVSNVNYAPQQRMSNPFMMDNKVDTFELSTPKKEVAKTPIQEATEKIKEGFSNAGEKFKEHVTNGVDVAAQQADKINNPIEGMAVSHVAANTGFIGQAVVGAGLALVEIAKGIAEAFKALA